MRHVLVATLFAVVFTVPTVVSAQIVPDCAPDCSFEDLVALGQNILNFIVGLSIIASGVMFAVAGFLLLTAGGDIGKVSKGKKIFGYVVVGLIIVLTAWLVINTILEVLTGRGFEERGGLDAAYHRDVDTPLALG